MTWLFGEKFVVLEFALEITICFLLSAWQQGDASIMDPTEQR